MLFWTFISILCLAHASPLNETVEPEEQAKLSFAINPNCDECSEDKVTLIYVKVYDETYNYTQHQIWDFTSDHPTILYIITDQNTTVDVKWKGTTPIDIEASAPIKYSYAVLLYNLIEYIDSNDTVFFDYNQSYRDISLRFTKWVWKDLVLTEDEVMLEMQGNLNPQQSGIKGSVKVQLRLRSTSGRPDAFPRLRYTPRTVQVDVSLVNLSSWYKDERARFAARFTVVSEGDRSKMMDYSVVKTNDDEYTPGVFKMNYLLSPSSQRKKGGCIVFRPVAFRDQERSIAASVPSSVWSYNRTTLPWECLAWRFYEHRQPLQQEAIFSFGDRGDGYYRQTSYVSWLFYLNYDVSYGEGYSPTMVVLSAVALALPAAALAAVLIYKTVRGVRALDK